MTGRFLRLAVQFFLQIGLCEQAAKTVTFGLLSVNSGFSQIGISQFGTAHAMGGWGRAHAMGATKRPCHGRFKPPMVSGVHDIPMPWGSANLSGIHLAHRLLSANGTPFATGVPNRDPGRRPESGTGPVSAQETARRILSQKTGFGRPFLGEYGSRRNLSELRGILKTGFSGLVSRRKRVPIRESAACAQEPENRPCGRFRA